jgi:hypothetical protein
MINRALDNSSLISQTAGISFLRGDGGLPWQLCSADRVYKEISIESQTQTDYKEDEYIINT